MIDIRTYGNIREAFGEKSFTYELSSGEVVSDVLSDLDSDCSGIALLEEFENGTLLVLKNGTHVTQLDGLTTSLEDGDRLSLTSPPMPEG